jgi:Ni,Fe-hydrogenase III large subunit
LASASHRAQSGCALRAELERLANHFGDIGAICNDAAFAMMHAQCGLLREQALRTADACFGHRLMMDRIVPGGVQADLPSDGGRQLRVFTAAARRLFPELVELYDNTASLQDRTVGTGILAPALADNVAGGHRRAWAY